MLSHPYAPTIFWKSCGWVARLHPMVLAGGQKYSDSFDFVIFRRDDWTDIDQVVLNFHFDLIVDCFAWSLVDQPTHWLEVPCCVVPGLQLQNLFDDRRSFCSCWRTTNSIIGDFLWRDSKPIDDSIAQRDWALLYHLNRTSIELRPSRWRSRAFEL